MHSGIKETSVSKDQPRNEFSLLRMVRRFFVSSFVVFSFVAYALHERFANPDGGISALAPTTGASPTQPAPATVLTARAPAAASLPTTAPAASPITAAASLPTTAPAASPTPPIIPTATALVNGQYRDGTFTGPEVDAFYGLVQVQAVIQNGKIADVKFLEYPNDRRTSVRINSIVMPWLTTEALQSQNANVDIISGATLTSEAFAQSLQAALDTAKN
jgi:uncharacterized protein with FMN-binding domain